MPCSQAAHQFCWMSSTHLGCMLAIDLCSPLLTRTCLVHTTFTIHLCRFHRVIRKFCFVEAIGAIRRILLTSRPSSLK